MAGLACRVRDRVAVAGRRFQKDTGGNIAVLFSIALLPFLSFIGAAVDYSVANSTRSKLIAAMDSAVLMAVSKAESQNTPAVTQANAIKFFKGLISAAGVTTSSFSLTVTDDNNGRSAVANFVSPVTTSFMKVAGIPTINVKGTSSSTVPLPSYIDFYLLLDNTPSMGVAATPTDVATMVANTPDKCAFACHETSNANDYYKLAKTLGVTMRIDVVRQATQQLMDTATAAATVPNQYRMSIYTFGSSCTSSSLTTISPLTSNLSSAKIAANNIDLMTTPKQNYNNDQCTDFDSVLADMDKAVPAPGPGTASLPQKYVFFVSDGVADAYYPTTCTKPTKDGRCQEPLTVAACTAMKARGIQIAVLYTTYLPLPTNGWYNDWIAPFNQSGSSQIAANMQSCASPGFYFEVSPTQGISDAMNALFKKAVARAHLTN